MNQREYLQTLSDEEYYNAIENLTDNCEWCPELKDGKMTCADDCCRKNGVAWLQSPHSTTADEDFLEIGFNFENITDVGHFYRKKERMAELRIWVDEKDTHYMTVGGWVFTDGEIDQIRKIATKKRSEMGWENENTDTNHII